MFKDFILWAEKAADEDAKLAISEMGYSATKTDPTYTADDPLTLDRIWSLCVTYLMGSKRWINQQNWQYRPYGRNNDNSSAEFLIDLFLWLSSGIAFQRGINWGKEAGSKVGGQILAIPGAAIGGIGGALSGAITAGESRIVELLSKQKSYSVIPSIRTGWKVGGQVGYNFGYGVGSFVGVVPGFLVGIVVGLGAATAMGVLTLAAGTAKLVETAVAVGKVVLNPFAWARGAKNVFNWAANTSESVNNYIKGTYANELSKYQQENPTPTVAHTTTIVELVAPDAVLVVEIQTKPTSSTETEQKPAMISSFNTAREKLKPFIPEAQSEHAPAHQYLSARPQRH